MCELGLANGMAFNDLLWCTNPHEMNAAEKNKEMCYSELAEGKKFGDIKWCMATNVMNLLN